MSAVLLNKPEMLGPVISGLRERYANQPNVVSYGIRDVMQEGTPKVMDRFPVVYVTDNARLKAGCVEGIPVTVMKYSKAFPEYSVGG